MVNAVWIGDVLPARGSARNNESDESFGVREGIKQADHATCRSAREDPRLAERASNGLEIFDQLRHRRLPRLRCGRRAARAAWIYGEQAPSGRQRAAQPSELTAVHAVLMGRTDRRVTSSPAKNFQLTSVYLGQLTL